MNEYLHQFTDTINFKKNPTKKNNLVKYKLVLKYNIFRLFLFNLHESRFDSLWINKEVFFVILNL